MVYTESDRLYEDGRHYDAKYSHYVDDIPFYVEMAERYGGPVLELFGGTGRLAIPIAQHGHDITCVDLSPEMMAYGKEKAGEAGVDIEWIEGDVRDIRLGRRFKLVTIPFTSLAHFHDMKDIEAVFETVKQHLADDGTFVMDVFNPNLDFMTRDPDDVTIQAEYEDPDGRGHVKIEETLKYDDAAQVNRIVWRWVIDGEEWKTVEFGVRVFYPEELLLLLEHNGFEVVERYGYFDESEFTPGSRKQVMVCRRKD